jgi:hypothetical protein
MSSSEYEILHIEENDNAHTFLLEYVAIDRYLLAWGGNLDCFVVPFSYMVSCTSSTGGYRVYGALLALAGPTMDFAENKNVTLRQVFGHYCTPFVKNETRSWSFVSASGRFSTEDETLTLDYINKRCRGHADD